MVSLRTFVISRILLTIPTILILLTLVFLVMRVMPGDPILAIVGMRASEEHMLELRKALGLVDAHGNPKPLYIQYIDYVLNVFRGDFGNSLIWGKRPVLAEILDHFPATVELTITGFAVSVFLGLAAGITGARTRGSRVDSTIRLYSIVSYALFIPWVGMLLQMILAVDLGLLPVAGRIQSGVSLEHITGLYVIDSLITMNWTALTSSLRHLILPSITLGVVLSGVFVRLTRNSMIEVMSQDFITAARARGLPEGVVLLQALKNSFIPILTMMGLQFALLLTGAILTETTFSWPGMGRLLMERISYRDYATVQGTVVFFAIMISLVSLVVDLVYAYIDPRIRY